MQLSATIAAGLTPANTRVKPHSERLIAQTALSTRAPSSSELGPLRQSTEGRLAVVSPADFDRKTTEGVGTDDADDVTRDDNCRESVRDAQRAVTADGAIASVELELMLADPGSTVNAVGAGERRRRHVHTCWFNHGSTCVTVTVAACTDFIGFLTFFEVPNACGCPATSNTGVGSSLLSCGRSVVGVA
jgi:hypothetical protein